MRRHSDLHQSAAISAVLLVLLFALPLAVVVPFQTELFSDDPIAVESEREPFQPGDLDGEMVLKVLAGDTVEEMTLGEYLVGVVRAEMPASFEPEALKAQAVAARTYTLYKMQTGGNHGDTADICTDSTCCQAYISEENARNNWGENADAYEEKIETAVRETDGETILYGGVPILAVFHSCSARADPLLRPGVGQRPALSPGGVFAGACGQHPQLLQPCGIHGGGVPGEGPGLLSGGGSVRRHQRLAAKRRDGHRRQRGVGGRGRREHEGQHFTERPGAAVRLLRVGGGGRQAGVLRHWLRATAWV